ncbi:hypothetical protein HDV00_000984 [Rhizophlyctis rosea]|nr:hypothetical protein HDV00_000984 [Rhizophlyctis rosea]
MCERGDKGLVNEDFCDAEETLQTFIEPYLWGGLPARKPWEEGAPPTKENIPNPDHSEDRKQSYGRFLEITDSWDCEFANDRVMAAIGLVREEQLAEAFDLLKENAASTKYLQWAVLDVTGTMVHLLCSGSVELGDIVVPTGGGGNWFGRSSLLIVRHVQDHPYHKAGCTIHVQEGELIRFTEAEEIDLVVGGKGEKGCDLGKWCGGFVPGKEWRRKGVDNVELAIGDGSEFTGVYARIAASQGV